jgi:hypothetical protein
MPNRHESCTLDLGDWESAPSPIPIEDLSVMSYAQSVVPSTKRSLCMLFFLLETA